MKEGRVGLSWLAVKWIQSIMKGKLRQLAIASTFRKQRADRK